MATIEIHVHPSNYDRYGQAYVEWEILLIAPRGRAVLRGGEQAYWTGWAPPGRPMEWH